MHVKFKAPNGSIGAVDGEFSGRVYVTWTYGMSSDGRPITATSSYLNYDQLVEIPKELYKSYAKLPAWSDEQRAVYAMIEGWLRFEADTAAAKRRAAAAERQAFYKSNPDCVCPCPPCICKDGRR
jgi:hypothetical protein